MSERVPLGSARLYSLTAAVTCPACGMPMFVVRPGKEGEPLDHDVKCPECRKVSKIGVMLLEKDLT